MSNGAPQPSRTVIAVSLSLFVAALVATLLPAWNRDVVFSLLGGPNAHSGHAGAWAGVGSFFLYLATTGAVVLAALVSATLLAVARRKWVWLLLCEILILGLSIWAGANEVLKDAI